MVGVLYYKCVFMLAGHCVLPRVVVLSVDMCNSQEGDEAENATNPNMNRGRADDDTDEEDIIPPSQTSPQQKKTTKSKVKKPTPPPPPPPPKRKAAKPLPPSDDEDEDEGVDGCDCNGFDTADHPIITFPTGKRAKESAE